MCIDNKTSLVEYEVSYHTIVESVRKRGHSSLPDHDREVKYVLSSDHIIEVTY